MKSVFRLLIVASCIPLIHSCSVQSGPLPIGVESQEPEMVALGRAEIKGILSGLSDSAQAINRIQSVLKRGLDAREETPESSEGRSLTLSSQSLLEPTNGDSLTFDSERPERFEYRLNNSTSLQLKTKSGGKITMTLSGSLIDSGGRYSVRDAKLNTVYSDEKGEQVFEILAQSNLQPNGEQSTEWSIDFEQLKALDRTITGEDSTAISLGGKLSVRITDSKLIVTADNFSFTSGNVVASFSVLNVQMTRGRTQDDLVEVKGSVLKNSEQIGSFAVSRSPTNSSAEVELSLSLEYDNVSL